ncbi:inhibitor of apoptosis protein 4 [Adoxophyes honmai nucleopolyhedrovirus]|uniref:Inhibitor of apoptosis protein 4 n=1 Tax=Adoxophyes honmai nucleopolyhedrovirus TaxID=224399 RepID=Q80LQ9_NPVAH|nr:inhibitor of apoptosis protein 4 [Adoxophyes honmai nucleopolyhedrovirus]BAC67288.1 inhibitor of apoptosis protein 4 [Adoxophyes honmai nucleopolyhedrovirus]
MAHVKLICVKIKGKLRVRIDDPAYRRDANCTFPKRLRRENATYTVSPDAISLICRSQCYYYIKPDAITVCKIEVDRVFTDETNDECIICMNEQKRMVAAPCGHYALCVTCSRRMRGEPCSLCRASVTTFVDYTKLNR